MSSKKCHVLLTVTADPIPIQGKLVPMALKVVIFSPIVYNPDQLCNLYKKLSPLKCYVGKLGTN